MYAVHVGNNRQQSKCNNFLLFFFCGVVVARLHSNMYTTTTTTDRPRERSVNYFLSHDIIPGVLVVVLGLK